ncbi:MAG TPA: FtsK/SpoIIIE domain-containing protein, partial [Anaerolineales bacterium]|nr:FtsK/SpoIIIE domain-containing protein [Anaerolineales bacterium]
MIPKIDSQAIQRLQEVILQTFNQAGLPVQIIQTIPGPWFCQLTIEAAPGAGQGFLGRFRPKKFAIQKTILDQTNFYLMQIDNPIPRRPRLKILALNRDIPSIPLQPAVTPPTYQQITGNLIFPLGVDLSGEPVSADLTTFPHLLVGGTTGGGKSVFVNSLLAGLLCRYSPDELRLVLCDGNTVELSPYQGIPHLAGKVATQSKEILPILDWLQAEVQQRLEAISSVRQELPYLLVVLEHTFIFTRADPRVSSLLTVLLPLAPRARVHFIFTASYPDAKVLPTAVKRQIPARVCFSVVDPEASRMVINQS